MSNKSTIPAQVEGLATARPLRCPFCAQLPRSVAVAANDSRGPDWWQISCGDCEVKIERPDKAMALRDWNSRPAFDVAMTLRTAYADFCAIRDGNIEPQAAALFAKDAAEYLREAISQMTAVNEYEDNKAKVERLEVALTHLLPRFDITADGECKFCGRNYGKEIPRDYLCANVDCDAFIARAALVESKPNS